MNRYAGQLLAPAEGLSQGLFLPFGVFWPIFGNFLSTVVTLVNFNSNQSNFEKN